MSLFYLLSPSPRAHVKRMILQKAMNLRTKRTTAAKKAETQRLRQDKIKQNYLSAPHLPPFSLLT
jgi:hypothetical protein